MKLPVSFKKSCTILIILSFWVAGMILYVQAWHPVSAKTTATTQEERQISPVADQEREILNQVQRQRNASHQKPAEPDWDLFRASRIVAQQLASQDSAEKGNIETMLSDLGYHPGSVHVLKMQRNRRPMDAAQILRDTADAKLLQSAHLSRIGVGYASGRNGQVWIVLYRDRAADK
ncbi:hypothetical protein [Sporolactobacillus terrae]|uniref:SCP domain-containing protein n=1 Tax=Sporolactobacillus terrae TaxID=269673 RepID=A0A410D7Y6_9BACL|nr:hypothetical protein [Sporolactobacillus terrae]QAA22241.1 hypothetical protein C0674_06215 [Sporolactobacillus terrae]QAA25215.1 hypothetical protein C0679_06190 [Sporolactobacillus terrae]UAK17031.1 hypothetical protein K7399_03555 [Sporolactobacillus terrae]BBN98552.1 hypothetical protein St703_12570 [Sporolactobacillus terrae]